MFRLNPSIFIVEDDPVYTKVVNHKLETNGFSNANSFSSGESALEHIRTNPDFVILDFSLEGLNGLDTLKAIKKQRPKTQVVVLTSVKNPELAKKCLDHGAMDYLEKSAESLGTIIDDLVKLRSRRRKVLLLAGGVSLVAIIAVTLLL